jgi:hypothetical protein
MGHATVVLTDLGGLAGTSFPKMGELNRIPANKTSLDGNMTFIPTQTGFMALEDSERLLRAIFPNYPNLEPCYPVPALEAISQASADGSN